MLPYITLLYHYVMLCYVMLCYVMLCYVMLCYVMLYHAMLCCLVIPHCRKDRGKATNIVASLDLC